MTQKSWTCWSSAESGLASGDDARVLDLLVIDDTQVLDLLVIVAKWRLAERPSDDTQVLDLLVIVAKWLLEE